MRLRPETSETGGLENHEESWAKFQDMPDLEQHRFNRNVYSRSGATPLQQDCLRVTGRFVRKIPDDVEQHRCYGTVYGSIRSEQEVNTLIPNLEQHPYHNMRVNSFARFHNPELKQQHRCYATVYVPLLEPQSVSFW